MKRKSKPGVPHRIRFGVSFDKNLHQQSFQAAKKERRSLSNWLEMAALETLGVPHLSKETEK
jgi:predicted HicB family RNase H-like nuclease